MKKNFMNSIMKNRMFNEFAGIVAVAAWAATTGFFAVRSMKYDMKKANGYIKNGKPIEQGVIPGIGPYVKNQEVTQSGHSKNQGMSPS